MRILLSGSLTLIYLNNAKRITASLKLLDYIYCAVVNKILGIEIIIKIYIYK
jgi:hypothetical protein